MGVLANGTRHGAASPKHLRFIRAFPLVFARRDPPTCSWIERASLRRIRKTRKPCVRSSALSPTFRTHPHARRSLHWRRFTAGAVSGSGRVLVKALWRLLFLR